MIALDTNVLVRYLMQDDAAQTPLANSVINALTAEEPAFVSREVLVELFWVLERVYRRPKTDIALAIRSILEGKEWRVEQFRWAVLALDRYEQGGAGFADQMIRLAGHAAGCDSLVTFDARLANELGVTRLG